MNPEIKTYDEQSLIAENYPAQSQSVTIGSGADLVRGAVLGRITASGQYVLSDDGASDGSEIPVAVLAEDAAAASAAVVAPIYVSGGFDAAKMTYGGAHTAATVEAAFRAASAPLFVITRHPL